MKNCLRMSVIVICLLFFSLNALGADEPWFSFSLSGGITSSLSGSAGEGPGAPDYSDAFGQGRYLSAEVSMKLTPAVSLLGGFGYETYSGDSYEGISFSDLDIYPVYIGMKYYFRNISYGWDPYLRADLGLARFESVEISYLGAGTRYWNSSLEFLIDAGTGIEYRMKSITWFAEIKARYMDNPSSALIGYSGAGGIWSTPVTFGIIVDF